MQSYFRFSEGWRITALITLTGHLLISQNKNILNNLNILVWYNEFRVKKSSGYMSHMEYRRSLGLAT